jgi:purine-binding chemotaxis protein CheW
VLEVGRPLPVTAVPHVPDWVTGVANVRGDIVSMIDLRTFLGLPSGDGADKRLLVVRSTDGETTTGLLVDRIRGIRALPAGRLTTSTASLRDPVAAYLRGVADLDGRLLAFLDLDRLLQAACGQLETV